MSKLYYNLEDYTSAVEWALKSEERFDIKENSLFDSFLSSKNYSMYTIKGIFSCLCDKWDKKFKIEFIALLFFPEEDSLYL